MITKLWTRAVHGGKAASVVEGFDANALLEQVSKSMNGAIAGYRNVLSNMRPGRADKRVFDSLTLEAYDDVVPVTQVAQVAVVSSTKFQLNVFDPTLVKVVENAVQGMNSCYRTSVQGSAIHVDFPKMSGEVRDEMVKSTKSQGEKTRMQIRKARQNGMKKVKGNKDIPKDDAVKLNEKVTDDAVKVVNELAKEKENELTQG